MKKIICMIVILVAMLFCSSCIDDILYAALLHDSYNNYYDDDDYWYDIFSDEDWYELEDWMYDDDCDEFHDQLDDQNQQDKDTDDEVVTIQSDAYMTTRSDGNGHEVPILHNFPNAINADTELSRYPIGTQFHEAGRDYKNASDTTYELENGEFKNLGAIECMAYARYVQEALYGDHDVANGNLEHFPILPESKNVDNTTLKQNDYELLKKLSQTAGPGAHMRVNGHSMIIIDATDDGITILDANAGSTYNVISKKNYTWSEFYNSWGKKGLEYIKTYQP